ncbi:uncharacterized protein FIBRA_04099 [Fibroporia radiculosa]|uniref:N-acetyltransferase domain-containing protein n=1 Tax=Fibroporia radiculosa TaxID=599839 RepID=J4G6U6_9APHY|nr:uncharacterized protein FIBRA_04099 [Fibroporia radiculosa]CCM02023.1 predicted protein [Fibroporia radiculosa]
MSTAYVNNFTPPPPSALPDPDKVLSSTEPYDINFAYPIHLESLSSDKVRLMPFVPRLHAKPLWESALPQLGELFQYYPIAPRTFPEFLAFVESIRTLPHWCMFAVYDKTRAAQEGESGDGGEGSFAGMMSLVNTVHQYLCTEIGYVMILPAFQRSHVARTSVSLLLQYCLNMPTASPPGLGFRRVAWIAHPNNGPSVGLAKKLGFQEEGVLRFSRILPDVEALNRVGVEVKRKGSDTREAYARHSKVLAVCWDDWESGVQEKAEVIIRQ